MNRIRKRQVTFFVHLMRENVAHPVTTDMTRVNNIVEENIDKRWWMDEQSGSV